MFTGLAFAIVLHVQRCNISAYHYNIVVYLLLMSCVTFMISAAVARKHFEDLTVSVLRLLLLIPIVVITDVAVIYQSKEPWPFNETGNSTRDATLAWPAQCLLEKGPNVRAGNFPLLIAFVVMFGFVGLHVFYQDAATDALQRLGIAANERFKYSRKYVWWLRWLLVAAGSAMTSVCFAGLMNLRTFMAKTDAFRDAAKGGPNPESTATTFGQLVPIILIVTILFAMLNAGIGTCCPTTMSSVLTIVPDQQKERIDERIRNEPQRDIPPELQLTSFYQVFSRRNIRFMLSRTPTG